MVIIFFKQQVLFDKKRYGYEKLIYNFLNQRNMMREDECCILSNIL